MDQTKPGFWPSDLDEATVCQAGRDYGQLQIDSNGNPFWVEYRPEAEGRNLLIRYINGKCECLTPDGFSVRSRVHEYGGDAWCLVDEGYVFVNAADQQIYRHSFNPESQPVRLTSAGQSRFLQPIWDSARNRLLVVEELHDAADDISNRLVSISLEDGAITSLHEGYDFYTYPTLNPLQDHLAFIAWNHPYQPWVSTELLVLEFDSEGAVVKSTVLAGQETEEALSQPFYSDNGNLYVISDREEWWNLYKADPVTLGVQAELKCESDMIASPWLAGPRHYSVTSSEIVHLKFQHKSIDLCLNGKPIILDSINHIRAIALSADQLICIVAGESCLPGVISLDLKRLNRHGTAQYKVLSGMERPLNSGSVSKPGAKKFGDVFGYFYPGNNPNCTKTDKYPLVIFLHGGPTAATYPVLNLKIQYWTQRGFSVLDLNYQGSSNYGRDYRMRLKHCWGELEITDIETAVTQLVTEGLVDRDAVFIRGNSSGGYSALNALCDLDQFAAGASLYGVSDPVALNTATHKFESYYLEWLIGDPEKDSERFKRFSPCEKAGRISAPVIFFQGEQDAVVVPEQTRKMVSKLQTEGVEVEACYFPEEGHGFRNMDNQIEVLQRELAFYQKRLNRD